jgi:hypothetical protein
LILDNCEHLIGACASLADALLQAAPGVRIIATSREALHIRGEQTYPVLPLRVPDRKGHASELMRSEAVQLFMERARLQKPDFSLSEREAPAASVCPPRRHSTGGELAAARMRSMSVEQINELARSVQAAHGGIASRWNDSRRCERWSLVVRPAAGKRADRSDRLMSSSAASIWRRRSQSVARSRWSPTTSSIWSPHSSRNRWSCSSTRAGRALWLLETIREFAQEHLSRQRYRMLETIRNSHRSNWNDATISQRRRRDLEYYWALPKPRAASCAGPKPANGRGAWK